ncbi:hypothetical protein, partial [Treponema sp. R6D11]
AFASPVFKTGALNHSAISARRRSACFNRFLASEQTHFAAGSSSAKKSSASPADFFGKQKSYKS